MLHISCDISHTCWFVAIINAKVGQHFSCTLLEKEEFKGVLTVCFGQCRKLCICVILVSYGDNVFFADVILITSRL